jgi:hypothetical protein
VLGHLGINVPDLGEARAYYDQLMPMVGFEAFFHTDVEFAYMPAHGKRGTFLFFYRRWKPRRSPDTSRDSSTWRSRSTHGLRSGTCTPGSALPEARSCTNRRSSRTTRRRTTRRSGPIRSGSCWRPSATTTVTEPRRRWRRGEMPPSAGLIAALRGDDPEPLLARKVRFKSPARDYSGRFEVSGVLRALSQVLTDVDVTLSAEIGAALATMFRSRVDCEPAESVLIEQLDGSGRVAEASLFLRPYGALRAGIARMRELLDGDPEPAAGRSAPRST